MDTLPPDTVSKPKPSSISKQPRLIACRECHRRHRSKLRCDREYPCKSCIKRGCADICPNGILLKTKRHKTSTIESTKLYEANESLNERIRNLEEALALSHAQFSNEPHPLLRDRLFLSHPQLWGRIFEKHVVDCAYEDPAGSISAYDTLAVGRDGKTVFHGAAANPEAILESEARDSSSEPGLPRNEEVSLLPPELLELGRLFPFGTPGERISCSQMIRLKGLLYKHLPPADKAWSLCEVWFENGAWLDDPIPYSEFLQHIFNPIYKTHSSDGIIPENLAVLFVILALGSFLDLRQQPYQAATESLYQLSCAAFCLTPIYESATISSIQALHLIGLYMVMTNRQDLEYRWLTMGLASKLIESSGMHRNSELWIQNNPAVNQRRCRVFWEFYTWDIWQSFHAGRSPGLSNPYIRCNMPLEVEKSVSPYNTWKYQYRYRCIVPVMEEVLGARSASHATILQLDRKIRDFEVPIMLRIPSFSGVPPIEHEAMERVPLKVTLQRYAVFCEREITLLHLHRSYFSQALQDSPANPLGNKYASSVFAAYRSASLIVTAVQDLSLNHPELASRIWCIWSSLFSAAIVLGNIVIRSPGSQLSSSALVELGVATGLLQTCTVRGRAIKVVPVVMQLNEKAQEVYEQHVLKIEATRHVPFNGPQHHDVVVLARRPRYAASNRSASTPSMASQSSSSMSPPPDVRTPETIPQIRPEVFDHSEGSSGYISLPLKGSNMASDEWSRLNSVDPEPYMEEYGHSSFHEAGNYGIWACHGGEFDRLQAVQGCFERGGYHDSQNTGDTALSNLHPNGMTSPRQSKDVDYMMGDSAVRAHT